ncbi:MAG: FAD:protein FMN transferase [Mycobacteriales bacterium]
MKRSWVEHVMGMPASILLRGDDVDRAAETVASAFADLHRIDAVFSTYRDDSDICRIRRRELVVADADPMVLEVIALCERARVLTEGWFDVDLPGGLDPSGLVKGWAIERVLERLSHLPGLDVCVNVAGDVAVRTRGVPFVAGVEDPRDRTALVAAVRLVSGGLATSGTAARGEHILDPRTGRPAPGPASVSVLGPSLMWADVYATATFARGGGLGWLARQSSYAGLVVHHDGRLQTTPGWPGPVRGGT